MNENNKEETKSCKKDKILNILLDKKTIFGVIIFTFVLFFIFCRVNSSREANLSEKLIETEKLDVATKNNDDKQNSSAIKKQDSKQKNNNNLKQTSENINKLDLVGRWVNTYDERSVFFIKKEYEGFNINAPFTTSASTGYEWNFYCKYSSKNTLSCTGSKMEYYPVCNGRKMESEGEAVECYEQHPNEMEKTMKETVKSNIHTNLNIRNNLLIFDAAEDFGPLNGYFRKENLEY